MPRNENGSTNPHRKTTSRYRKTIPRPDLGVCPGHSTFGALGISNFDREIVFRCGFIPPFPFPDYSRASALDLFSKPRGCCAISSTFSSRGGGRDIKPRPPPLFCSLCAIQQSRESQFSSHPGPVTCDTEPVLTSRASGPGRACSSKLHISSAKYGHRPEKIFREEGCSSSRLDLRSRPRHEFRH